LIVVDSTYYSLTKNIWLQGGLMVSIWRNISVLINKESIYIDKIGK